ncbi:MAG: Crp/Fnr family transcriptional regulator [Trueperaceae bacterium]|nr:Crp/Fnr family transcriptional regulator [Trueperaceae bacterium]
MTPSSPNDASGDDRAPHAELLAFLADVPLFSGADDRLLDIVAGAVQKRAYPAGAVLFREGDVGEAVYLLRQGTVKLSKVDLGGHEKTLALLRPPEFFGEMAPLSEGTRSATAVAVENVEALLLFGDDFHRLMRDHPRVGLNVNTTLARRLRGMDDEAQVLSYKDAQGRVAYVLLQLHRAGVVELSDGPPLIRLTHQELANMAGTSRETVTRALRALEAEGVIETRPKEILLTDTQGLEEVLHGVR